MRKIFNGIKSRALDLFFPKICGHCGNSFKDGLSNVLCQDCFNSIPLYEAPLCGRCGLPLPPRAFEESVLFRCRDCGDGEYFLDGTRAVGAYGGALRVAHHSFKFEGMESLGAPIGKKMAEAANGFSSAEPCALVPVPLSPERKRERGYNPSEHLAIQLSKRMNVPIRLSLQKIKRTIPQMSLSRLERFKNPRGAYAWISDFPVPQRILLVDDVFTTGSTLEECAKVLKKAGAQWVSAIVFGRTPRI